jgi:hypothetical protein
MGKSIVRGTLTCLRSNKMIPLEAIATTAISARVGIALRVRPLVKHFLSGL